MELRREELLIERLKAYEKSGMYPFHMPGHKRQREGFLDGFPNPYLVDITEIEGFDNLHHPEGILRKSMEFAANVYGADRTYYLINGSSAGILSAISAAANFGETIIVGRNCHKSVYHGIILKKLRVKYIYPQIIRKMWISGGISVENVDKVLKETDAKAVLLVSPTYEGVVSDIREIAKIVHRRKIPLIVDEAHGAHFSFAQGSFPESALDCGADIVIQSLHKTLPSFTQTAVLHVKSEYVNIEKLEWYLQVYQSSSPSYIMMAGIETCIFEMNENGKQYLKDFEIKIKHLRENLSKMKCLKILNESVIGNKGVYDLDQSKIVVSCCGTSLTGTDLGQKLREIYNLEMEMCGPDYVVAITTFLDTQMGLDRLERAFLEIDRQLSRENRKKKSDIDKWTETDKIEKESWWNKKPDIQMIMADAMEKNFEVLKISECEGRISAEFIYLYPPGIPIVAPGERVTGEIIRQIYEYKKMGLPVQGMADRKAECLRIIDR